MDAFARIRTRSLLFKLWPEKTSTEKVEKLNSCNERIDEQLNQNNHFLHAIKNGGIWFS